LIELYSNIINSRIEEIDQSERIIKENNIYFAIGIIVVLGLILILIILIISNVNKSLSARKALEQANQKIKETLESRHRLLLSVSHDIKTPLNSILGYLELSNDPEFYEKNAASMKNSGKHILALLDNLLGYSSLEQGSLRSTKNKFSLKELCLDIIEMFIPLAYQKNLSFSYDLNFDPQLVLYSDKIKIKQIIINILSNSIKYTTSGEINLRVSYEDNMINFHITDTGAGIPEEQINNIFIPFLRIEKNNSIAEGSGLGMYVVKGLVDLLNGEIKINSKVDVGTGIVIRIPAITKSINNEIHHKKLLIIDDDMAFLTMIKELLSRLGHDATTCLPGTEFNYYLKHIKNFDIVITDMEMNNFSGMVILEKIKKESKIIPVIIMTARDDFDNIKATDLGFDGYIRKPLDISSIHELLGGTYKAEFDSKLLEQMFDNDKNIINEILITFINSTKGNIKLLHQSIIKNNFIQAQEVCHRMLPMFMQLGEKDSVIILKKMDFMRGKKSSAYPQWKNDVRKLIKLSTLLINQIEENYFQD